MMRNENEKLKINSNNRYLLNFDSKMNIFSWNIQKFGLKRSFFFGLNFSISLFEMFQFLLFTFLIKSTIIFSTSFIVISGEVRRIN